MNAPIMKGLAGLILLLPMLSAYAQTTVKYVHTDALGSVVAMTDAAGAVIQTAREYEPYGQQLTPAVQDGPGYTGHVQDAATGLTYMQQRYYDPEIGRFLSVDPVTAYSNPVGAFNRYRYTNSNPYKFTDPDGRFAILVAPLIPPALVALGKAVAYTGAVLGGLYLGDKISDQIQQSQGESPPLPTDLVGTDDGKGGRQGGRVNNGPLAPENDGGGGDDESDFGQLTGGRSSPAPADKGYPPGTRIGENGISHRPARGRDGPRIDIPENGDKPHETLHYPKPPPPEKSP